MPEEIPIRPAARSRISQRELEQLDFSHIAPEFTRRAGPMVIPFG